MDNEQLKQEAEEYCADNCGNCYFCNKKYRKNKNCEKIKSMIKTYLAAAEPREKVIVELKEQIVEVNEMNTWYSAENPPKNNMEQVIAEDDYGTILMAWYCVHEKKWYNNECPDPDDEITVVRWKKLKI